MTNQTPLTTEQEDWKKEFDKLWRRIANTIKTNHETRKIWCPDLDDDYSYVDETLKRFIKKVESQAIKQERSRVVEMIENADIYIEAKDNDGHRYQIPNSKQQEWDDFLEIPEDDERSWDVPYWVERIDGMPIKQHGLNKLLEALKEQKDN